MPKYKKKRTHLMNYDEFKLIVDQLPDIRDRAFLTVLFFSGCRVSEALALTPDDITCTKETIYLQVYRLKGSKQTDPIELPKADALHYLCGLEEDPFPFGRRTAHRLVRSCFPDLYPHYFRMNRITKILDKHGVVAVQNTFGLSLNAIQDYIGKIDIKRVRRSLAEEIGKS